MKARESSPPLGVTKPHSTLGGELTRLRSALELANDQNEALREAQGALEQSRDAYAELYDFAPLALITLNQRGMIGTANLAVAELLGADRAWLVGRLFITFVHEQDRQLFTAFLAEQSASAPRACAVRLLLRDGRALPVRAVRRDSPQPGAVHLTLLDLREEQREAVEKQRLIEAEQRARDALSSKDHFIAMLSHELRTPLTPVLAAASTYRRSEQLPAEQRDVFEMIERNVTAEARLIDDLLDATGIARGKLRVLRAALDVHPLLRECVNGLASRAQIGGVALQVRFDARASVVDGDELRLRQVFGNLLQNALSYTPPGGTVRISTWNHEQRLLIEVEDDGAGFEPALAESLFAAFEQAGRQARNGGLGLGLAISKGLVELHAGRIAASSAGPGRGARFLIDLPVRLAQLVEDARPDVEPVAPPSGARESGVRVASPRRLLLVEDHRDTAEMMRALLELEGFEVVVAGSMSAALAVELSEIDAILSDIGLPDGSGTDLLRQMDRRGAPAIALSGYGTPADVERSREAGFDLHLTKPISFEKLLKALEQLLEERDAAP